MTQNNKSMGIRLEGMPLVERDVNIKKKLQTDKIRVPDPVPAIAREQLKNRYQ
jgi:hypothetical protein